MQTTLNVELDVQDSAKTNFAIANDTNYLILLIESSSGVRLADLLFPWWYGWDSLWVKHHRPSPHSVIQEDVFCLHLVYFCLRSVPSQPI